MSDLPPRPAWWALLLVGAVGFLTGAVAQHSQLLPVVERGEATALLAPAERGAGRDVEVVPDGLDLLVRLDRRDDGWAVEVRVREGARLARLAPAAQRADGVAAFAYLEVAVDAEWAFVFGHAIRTLEPGVRYEVDGIPAPPVPRGEPMFIHLAPR